MSTSASKDVSTARCVVSRDSAFGAPLQQSEKDGVPIGARDKRNALYSLTMGFVDTYKACNPDIKVVNAIPQRLLTNPSDPMHNQGLDNEECNLICRVHDKLISSTREFVVLDLLGTGTFGQVFRCQCRDTKELVAVKVIKNKPAYHKQGKLEIKIAKQLNGAPNLQDRKYIVRYMESFLFQNHICIVFELLSMSLLDVLSQNQFRGLPLGVVQRFTKQILTALLVLESTNIVHCDLKPENVLLVPAALSSKRPSASPENSNSKKTASLFSSSSSCSTGQEATAGPGISLACGSGSEKMEVSGSGDPVNVMVAASATSTPSTSEATATATAAASDAASSSSKNSSGGSSSHGPLSDVKVIDFGSACFEGSPVYAYIQSRFYRSPEVLLGLPYNGSIDMWSLACVCAEMYLGLPLFPGVSQHNQLSRIVEMLGLPPSFMIEGKNGKKFFTKFYEVPPVPMSTPVAAGTNEQQPSQPKIRFRLKTAEEYAAETNTKVPVLRKYLRYNRLDEVIMKCPLPHKHRLTSEQKAAELQRRRCFLDFLHGLFRLNPFERWTAKQAFAHPFIQQNLPFEGPFVPPVDPRVNERKLNFMVLTQRRISAAELGTSYTAAVSGFTADKAAATPIAGSSQQTQQALAVKTGEVPTATQVAPVMGATGSAPAKATAGAETGEGVRAEGKESGEETGGAAGTAAVPVSAPAAVTPAAVAAAESEAPIEVAAMIGPPALKRGEPVHTVEAASASANATSTDTAPATAEGEAPLLPPPAQALPPSAAASMGTPEGSPSGKVSATSSGERRPSLGAAQQGPGERQHVRGGKTYTSPKQRSIPIPMAPPHTGPKGGNNRSYQQHHPQQQMYQMSRSYHGTSPGQQFALQQQQQQHSSQPMMGSSPQQQQQQQMVAVSPAEQYAAYAMYMTMQQQQQAQQQAQSFHAGMQYPPQQQQGSHHQPQYGMLPPSMPSHPMPPQPLPQQQQPMPQQQMWQHYPQSPGIMGSQVASSLASSLGVFGPPGSMEEGGAGPLMMTDFGFALRRPDVDGSRLMHSQQLPHGPGTGQSGTSPYWMQQIQPVFGGAAGAAAYGSYGTTRQGPGPGVTGPYPSMMGMVSPPMGGVGPLAASVGASMYCPTQMVPPQQQQHQSQHQQQQQHQQYMAGSYDSKVFLEGRFLPEGYGGGADGSRHRNRHSHHKDNSNRSSDHHRHHQHHQHHHPQGSSGSSKSSRRRSSHGNYKDSTPMSAHSTDDGSPAQIGASIANTTNMSSSNVSSAQHSPSGKEVGKEGSSVSTVDAAADAAAAAVAEGVAEGDAAVVGAVAEGTPQTEQRQRKNSSEANVSDAGVDATADVLNDWDPFFDQADD